MNLGAVRSERRHRWELSEEETKRIVAESQRSMSVRALVRAILRSPRLGLELVRAALHGAIGAIRSGSTVVWAIDAERTRAAVPDAASGVAWAGGERFLEPLRELIEPGMRVADIGCGAGRFARHAAPSASEVVCVDSSSLMLREAREQLSGFVNVSYVRNAGFTLSEIADESVDLAFSQGLFAYIGPREFVALAAEARRILRPGGVLLLSAFGYAPDTAAPRLPDPGRLHAGIPEPYTPGFLVRMVELAGFEGGDGVQIEVDPIDGYAILTARRRG